VARLFDKDPPTAWPTDLPLPYSSENPPPSVRALYSVIIIQSVINISPWLVIQDLYPDRQVDVELSDGDNNNGQNKPIGDEAEGKEAPSIKLIAPNSTKSSMARDTHPSATGQIAAASSGSRQKKKNVLLASKRKKPTPLADQVMTHINLPPYREPQSPLNLGAVEIVFGCLFEAFGHSSQAASTGTSARVDTQLVKKARALPSKRMLTPKYVIIFLLFFLLPILIRLLMI
jgi:hypothetical protein